MDTCSIAALQISGKLAALGKYGKGWEAIGTLAPWLISYKITWGRGAGCQ